jgi:uncharacterized OB-fold protein
MSTCPKCGANNKPNQEACRLCATPLERAGEVASPRMIDSLAATVVAQDRDFQQSDQAGGEVPCPTCQTMNERSWAFCQHCGSKLRPEAAQAPPPPPPERLHQAPATVVVPSIRDNYAAPVSQPQAPPAPSPAPPVEPPTTVVPPPSAERQAQRPQPQNPQPQNPQPQNPQVPKPQPQPPQAPPAYDVRQPPTAPPTVAEPPPRQGQRLNAPSGTEQVESSPPAAKIPGVPCVQCGYQNAPGSGFCGGCGMPMQVASTIVMSSVQATPKGRLHLIMEGGQQGEVYELKDDTAIGRTMGDISFPHDGFMSSRHARIVRRDDSFVLVDEGSRNGTFIKIKGEVELKPGDMILIGKQLFRFEV